MNRSKSLNRIYPLLVFALVPMIDIYTFVLLSLGSCLGVKIIWICSTPRSDLRNFCTDPEPRTGSNRSPKLHKRFAQQSRYEENYWSVFTIATKTSMNSPITMPILQKHCRVLVRKETQLVLMIIVFLTPLVRCYVGDCISMNVYTIVWTFAQSFPVRARRPPLLSLPPSLPVRDAPLIIL